MEGFNCEWKSVRLYRVYFFFNYPDVEKRRVSGGTCPFSLDPYVSCSLVSCIPAGAAGGARVFALFAFLIFTRFFVVFVV